MIDLNTRLGAEPTLADLGLNADEEEKDEVEPERR
jgi:hypothetical protein